MGISDWSSDVCSSDLYPHWKSEKTTRRSPLGLPQWIAPAAGSDERSTWLAPAWTGASSRPAGASLATRAAPAASRSGLSSSRSEEHTSELQSLMRISYAVFCLKKKNQSTSV